MKKRRENVDNFQEELQAILQRLELAKKAASDYRCDSLKLVITARSIELTDYTLRGEKGRRAERISNLRKAITLAKNAIANSRIYWVRKEAEFIISTCQPRLFRLEGIELMHNLKAEEAKKQFEHASGLSKRLRDFDGVKWCEAAMIEAEAEKLCGDYASLPIEEAGEELLLEASSKFDLAFTTYADGVANLRNIDETSRVFCNGMKVLCMLLASGSPKPGDPKALKNLIEWETAKKQLQEQVPEFFSPRRKDTIRSRTRLELLLQSKLIPRAAEFEREWLEKQIERKADELNAQVLRRFLEKYPGMRAGVGSMLTLGHLLHQIPGTPQTLLDLNSAWIDIKHYETIVAKEGKAAVEARLDGYFAELKPLLLDGTLDQEIARHDDRVKKALGLN